MRRNRAAILALLACIIAAQALLVVHRIDHTSVGHHVACALCTAADHQAGPVAQADHALALLSSEPIEFLGDTATGVEPVLAYRSRAPPRS